MEARQRQLSVRDETWREARKGKRRRAARDANARAKIQRPDENEGFGGINKHPSALLPLYLVVFFLVFFVSFFYELC